MTDPYLFSGGDDVSAAAASADRTGELADRMRVSRMTLEDIRPEDLELMEYCAARREADEAA